MSAPSTATTARPARFRSGGGFIGALAGAFGGLDVVDNGLWLCSLYHKPLSNGDGYRILASHRFVGRNPAA
ncbi:hypothetical protein ACFYWU_12590 [Streptomyces chrestomyceticus]|uniref:hypothetical protein n=1 Tax=Streptomyces chrestomyceticus TaxID=68185 RepID=UPI0036742653